MKNEPSPSRPSHYAIRTKDFLDSRREWLEGLTVTHVEPGEALLSGTIVGQAALHGLIAQIRDPNLKSPSRWRLSPTSPLNCCPG
jgi:hypothetical protein